MDSRSTQIPSNIGRFRIEALLGSGGMGEVYKAFDPTLQRTVAVKTVRPDIDRPDFLERLYREAQACARLQHPNIVTVFEAGEFNGIVYIAMEYLKGDSLSAVLRRGDLTFDQKIKILVQILSALQHAHNEDVVHRDIKPSNVNRQPDGSIKLLDFGLARMVRAETLTLSGAIMGTPHYASPEQLRGERVDHRTDIYSTGALAYEMLSGRRPFDADNDSVATILFKVLSETPAPMDTMFSRKFPEIESIVAKAMQKAPDDRYQTAQEMCDALSVFLDTKKEAISVAQTESQLSAQRTILEAKNLRAAGMVQEAETLLTNALKENPEASPVRTMLDESRPPTPMPPPRPQIPMPVAPIPGPNFTTGYQTRAVDSGVAVPMPPPRRVPKALWWAAGGAAVLALAAGAALMQQDRTGDSDSTVAAAIAPSNPATDPAPATPTNPPSAAGGAGEPAGAAPPPTASALIPPPPPPTAATGTASTPVPPATKPAETKPSGTATPAAAVPTPTSAKAMYTSAATSGANPGLKYRVVQQTSTGGQSDADPATVFKSGDRVRFNFESNIDGYLYVVLQGSTGRWTVLFPDPEINQGRNTIKRGERYDVPGDNWFLFDENPGTEQVFVILSKEPLNQLPGFKAPVTQTESVQAAVVNDLQARILSRDLIMEKEKPQQTGGRINQASYVVNPDELGKSVAALIRLNHGK